MPRARRRPLLGVTLAATLLAVLLAPAGASAHAVLVGTSPQRGATLPQQPGTVTLRFSESVEGNFGAVRVFDAAARRVDDGNTIHPHGLGSQLAVGLKPGLAQGTYVATYRVISADSHPISGGLVFSVGKPGATAAPTVSDLIGKSGAGPITAVAFGVARGLDYLATALLLGGLAFLLAVWLPALRCGATAQDAWHDASSAFLRRLRRLLLGAAALGVVGAVAGIVLQGATAAATDAWSAIDPSVIGDVLGTRFGHVWGLRALAFVVLGVAAWRALRALPEPGATPALQRVALGAGGLAAPGPPRAASVVGALAAAYVAIAPALGGHASVTSPVALLFGLDVLHVLAMSVWIGGLVVLLGTVPAATRRLPAAERSALLAAVLVRFSPIALICVAVLLVTGTVQAFEHIGAWGQLLHTGFGRAVLIKVVLLAVLIGLGAINRRHVLPRLRELAATAASPGAVGRVLRRTLRAEVALVMAVLAVTAALVSYPPPDTLASGPFDGTARLGPLTLEATVDPARVGPNEIHLYVLKAGDGTPFDATKQLSVTLSLPGKGIGPLPATARAAGPGHYVVDTVQLVPGGDWRLHVTSRVSDFDQYDAALRVPVR
ncbi:MAG TPA: copper resistance protein CopC [Solirubrobacteraceae bacterium]|jgi:copper transport protein|nr:copper resistance protein CopC [Solirubrobacteraceae bacterium]